MKSLVSFWAQLANELADLCGIDASRDVVTLSRRTEDEGDSFLRITLPSFGKAFDQALERGQFSSDLATGFRRRGGLPLFLGGFLRNIFGSNGVLLHDPCVESIRSVRQLCAVFGKIEGECTPQRNNAAVRAFVEADDACNQWDLASPSSLIQEMIDVSNRLLAPWLASADRKILRDELIPRHGPGQTADRLLGNQKYDMQFWPDSLEARFPWCEWGIPNYRYGAEAPDDWAGAVASPMVVPARLSLVPKTMSSPRTIVMEPTANQYMQQALMAVLVEATEASTTMVGFTDQSRNRDMARSSSIRKDLATLDLSEASDRVTYLQAAAVFSVLPNIWEALDATRSDDVQLPDGTVRSVFKFASMGSAVCFPVEAMVFLVAVFVAIRDHHRKADAGFDLTRPFLRKLEGRVRVYGDDIIVPVEYLPEVRAVFALLGWKINTNKSFAESFFRESCGGDYWRGCDVTPVRARQLFPDNLRQIERVQSLVSLRNQLYFAGYWRTAGYLDDQIRPLLRGSFPVVGETSAALGRHSVCFEALCLGTDRYQRALTKAYVIQQVIPKNPCSEIGALLKCLTAPGWDSDHLVRSGRPVDAYINRRWIPVH